MNESYRGHDIVIMQGTSRCAVIVEHGTGVELPTKVTAFPDEADHACIRRARHLIDLYLDTLSADLPALPNAPAFSAL